MACGFFYRVLARRRFGQPARDHPRGWFSLSSSFWNKLKIAIDQVEASWRASRSVTESKMTLLVRTALALVVSWLRWWLRSGTSQRTMKIVTNHGMPVRWSTAHYRFSRAPCTATLYRRPSLARSFTSFCLCSSQSTSLALSPKFPSSFYQSPFLHALSLSLSFSLSLSHFPSRSLLRAVVASRSRILFLQSTTS